MPLAKLLTCTEPRLSGPFVLLPSPGLSLLPPSAVAASSSSLSPQLLLPPPPAMSHLSECESSGRARSRLHGGSSGPTTRIASVVPDPVGELSGNLLIPCPECGVARVVEGRTKKDSDNHGRMYFKCPRNAFPNLCGYYRFEKQYFQHLKDMDIVLVRSSNLAQVVEGQEVDNVVGYNDRNGLEVKLENLA